MNSSFTEKYIHAEYDELAQLSDNISLVRGRHNGVLMIRKTVPAENSGVYKTLAGLQLPGIAHIFSVTPGKRGYDVLYKYIEGMTVKEYIENNGVFGKPEADRLICEICTSLCALHRMGIIHRDITASNVIIGADGHCYLIDFGISRTVKPGQSSDTEILGTAGFAAPEQFGFRQTDARSDIYSVGVLMSYMISGKMPSGSQVSESVNAVAAKCMAMEPDNRYTSASELKNAIEKPARTRRSIMYGFLGLSLALIAIMFFGEGTLSYHIYLALGCIFCLIIPIAVAADIYGLLRKIADRFSWRMGERIFIRCVIIIISMIFFAIIAEFIHPV
ncbi:MAG: serine/threonine-protein kinase [Clostridiales bacterium]|nr:serine/threonine-protein kinase [Clostridiales bacterium]